MKEILEILTNYFSWQRKESIEKATAEIKENYVEWDFVEWLKQLDGHPYLCDGMPMNYYKEAHEYWLEHPELHKDK